MTFVATNLEYRVAFDLASNLFLAIDVRNEENFASGVTIEQAIAALAEK